MIPWQFAAYTFSGASESLFTHVGVISKIYFPRVIAPISALFVNLVDLAVSLALMAVFMLFYGIAPDARVFALPLFILAVIPGAVGMGLWFAAVSAKYRDFRNVVPFIVMLSLYASPVGFPTSLVPQAWRFWYWLNPLVGAIEGFRWCLFGGEGGAVLAGNAVVLCAFHRAIDSRPCLLPSRRTDNRGHHLRMSGRDILAVAGLSKQYRRDTSSSGKATSFRELISQSVRGLFRGARSQIDPVETKEFWALRDVSFSLQEGTRLGVIGRNGAGKSTLLKILSRITEPSTGRIDIYGRTASLLEIGTGFHPELSGRENIYLNGALLGMGRSEVRRKLDQIVDFAEIEEFLDEPVKHYSSGMYVRLAFAIAAHVDPDILILDEVLAVGDVQFQRKCFGRMEELGKAARSVTLVSHDLTAVAALCDRCLVLDAGKIMFDGTPSEGIAKYYGANLGAAGARRFETNAKGSLATRMRGCWKSRRHRRMELGQSRWKSASRSG